jgi:hypothetical protein
LYLFEGFLNGLVDFCFSCVVLSYLPFQLPMFVIWKGWVANVLAKKIVGFNSSYEFQFPIDELSLLAIQVSETFLGLR